MELLNECQDALAQSPVADAGEHAWVYRDTFDRLLALLSPFAPHVTQELWEVLGHAGYIVDHPWPSYDPAVLEAETVRLAVQVDGRLRGTIDVSADLTDEESLLQVAAQEANVARHLEGRTLVRTVVVPGKIISLITS